MKPEVKDEGADLKATSSQVGAFVEIGKILKRHSFKENKWKALAHSGYASPWLSSLREIFLGSERALSPVKIEVPGSDRSEFYLFFESDAKVNAGDALLLRREDFPQLPRGSVYVCDLMGLCVQSDLGEYKIISFFENSKVKGLSSLSLLLEPVEEDGKAIEIPFQSMRPLPSKEGELHWWVDDIGSWFI